MCKRIIYEIKKQHTRRYRIHSIGWHLSVVAKSRDMREKYCATGDEIYDPFMDFFLGWKIFFFWKFEENIFHLPTRKIRIFLPERTI